MISIARFRLRPREEKAVRPTVSDDYIYDEPEKTSPSSGSDTPEEALRKLHGNHSDAGTKSGEAEEDGVSVDSGSGKNAASAETINSFRKKTRASSSVLLDEDLQPVTSRR